MSSAFADGLSGGGIFGPGVFGVATFEFPANFGVGVDPEAGEIVGDLLRAEVGSQQMQDQRDATSGDARCLLEPKDFLNADGENWGPIRGVFELDAAAAGDFDSIGGITFDGLQLRIVECSLQCVQPGCGPEFFKGSSSVAEAAEDVAKGCFIERGEIEFGDPFAEETGALDKGRERLIIGRHDGIELSGGGIEEYGCGFFR